MKEKDISNIISNAINEIVNNYVLFKIDLSKINSDVRFFYDINEEKGIYTKSPINANNIVSKTYIYAKSSDKLSSNLGNNNLK